MCPTCAAMTRARGISTCTARVIAISATCMYAFPVLFTAPSFFLLHLYLDHHIFFLACTSSSFLYSSRLLLPGVANYSTCITFSLLAFIFSSLHEKQHLFVQQQGSFL